jgi:hypothetical protein
MIDFNDIKKRHFLIKRPLFHIDMEESNIDMEECNECQSGKWPCDTLLVLDEFELFMKKIIFSVEIVNSWIKDYSTDS